MWSLTNQTPYAAERGWVRDSQGAEVWLVAVKATFLILQDGSTHLADTQEPVLLEPVYSGEPGLSSLRYESDMVRTKGTTDVLLHGHAYANPPCRAMEVRLKVGTIDKCLCVFGDRIWEKPRLGWGMTKSRPGLFEKLPLIYERAFGGVDQIHRNPKKHGWEPRNPVGVGFGMSPEHLHGQPLPNIEDPRERITSWKVRPQPAGFGPIAGAWDPRISLAGTYDEAWVKARHPLVPTDFDDRYFQCSPEDQRPPTFLKGGECVELYNLTPTGFLAFSLPRITLRFTTLFCQGDAQEHRADLHTVILEPDVPRAILVWVTALPCHARVQDLEETILREKQRVALSPKGNCAPGVDAPFAGKVWQ